MNGFNAFVKLEWAPRPKCPFRVRQAAPYFTYQFPKCAWFCHQNPLVIPPENSKNVKVLDPPMRICTNILKALSWLVVVPLFLNLHSKPSGLKGHFVRGTQIPWVFLSHLNTQTSFSFRQKTHTTSVWAGQIFPRLLSALWENRHAILNLTRMLQNILNGTVVDADYGLVLEHTCCGSALWIIPSVI